MSKKRLFIKIPQSFTKKQFLLLNNKFLSLKSEYIKSMISNDSDFIWSKKYKFSLKNAIDKKYVNLSDKTISKYLKLTLFELNNIYDNIIIKLRQDLKIEGK